ncbi:MAG: HD domain-containing protein [Fibrobacteria bacterium]|nr:HD domain-containing protein [Fibrobacteria bacterium]
MNEAETRASLGIPRDLAEEWEPRFREWCRTESDVAHDPSHVERVVSWALKLAAVEHADAPTVWAAAWLHDLVHIPKNSPRRAESSRLSAEEAGRRLAEAGWSASPVEAVCHAIAAHSFSAGILPRTREAEVVQDADRLEALGAIGLARCLMLGGQMGSILFDPEDPWARNRPLRDDRICVDHFFAKLLRLSAGMRTEAGRGEARRRTEILGRFLEELAREAGLDDPPFAGTDAEDLPASDRVPFAS